MKLLFLCGLVDDALDEEQKAIQQTAHQFAQTEMAPMMYEWDRTVRISSREEIAIQSMVI